MKDLSHDEWALILELHDHGLTQAEIAAQIRRSQSIVSRSLNYERPEISPDPGPAVAEGRRRGRARRSGPREQPALAVAEEAGY
jgi:IS30 family transposase